MNKEEFYKLDFIEKIDYFNSKLRDGQTVIRIREDIGISEKTWQKEVKNNNYKYDTKSRLYIATTTSTTETTTSNNVIVMDNNTNTLLSNNDKNILNYLGDNFDILKAFLEKYKATTNSTTETTTNTITINLIDDKHLSPKPKSIRINEFVYQDWKKFCDNQNYSKMDLISMALKEYMEKYK